MNDEIKVECVVGEFVGEGESTWHEEAPGQGEDDEN